MPAPYLEETERADSPEPGTPGIFSMKTYERMSSLPTLRDCRVYLDGTWKQGNSGECSYQISVWRDLLELLKHRIDRSGSLIRGAIITHSAAGNRTGEATFERKVESAVNESEQLSK